MDRTLGGWLAGALGLAVALASPTAALAGVVLFSDALDRPDGAVGDGRSAVAGGAGTALLKD
ncbi:MAG: hypothetical protein Q8Q88_06530 [Phenylobacterium sp.]|uniref:hypothetical protein n=1 Tax=Phenylobacterium sp. TaxID=1871053 RepID=UPI002734D0FB|nr:hypothetical protein [Phenylobacterium sp.]MDP3746690.1 hypothetical protein [Phenylobacterium sp.]